MYNRKPVTPTKDTSVSTFKRYNRKPYTVPVRTRIVTGKGKGVISGANVKPYTPINYSGFYFGSRRSLRGVTPFVGCWVVLLWLCAVLGLLSALVWILG